ncbi:Catenin alpha-2 [Xenoophorus captivus]|uniref:Catenin alpha-2 n=1 Tax=Xenoophorus captivus TaxID=1517983 RepID=A0ABV0QFA0_9TELE
MHQHLYTKELYSTKLLTCFSGTQLSSKWVALFENSMKLQSVPFLLTSNCNTAIMAQLPQEEKAKIAEQVESFRQEKCKLDAEVAKWDDNGNDIIVLAKQMCMIMMEMTDFTR